MRTNTPEKLLKIIEEIDERGTANLTKLTVLKKWFQHPRRLSDFAIWIAQKAVSRKGKTIGETAALFKEAKIVLGHSSKLNPKLDKNAAEKLHDRLRDFQNEYRNVHWGSVRIINNWNLMLIEKGLAIYLWHDNSPSHGYKLAVNYCQNYDPRYGNGLNGVSRTKIHEIIRFMFTMEALEDDVG